MELTGLQIFKYLPGAKKLPESNCKKCGFPTCMAYALKLAKQQAKLESCPNIPDELKEKFLESVKIQQHEIKLGTQNSLTVGGETVMFRHDKTFINRTGILIKLDSDDKDFGSKLEKIKKYSIDRVGETFKVEGVYLVGKENLESAAKKIDSAGIAIASEAFDSLQYNPNGNVIISGNDIEELAQNAQKSLYEGRKNIILNLSLANKTIQTVLDELTQIRRQAILKRFEPLTYPVLVKMPENMDNLKVCAYASMLICRYANIIVLNDFDEALLASLYTLRQNVYTNPQKPLQVESKVYEFNDPDENALVLMTTNFALTYFAVANELESMPFGSYLIVTPSDGMSVLTAWSADKFNAEIVAKMMSKTDLSSKVKKREIIIPGLLSHMKEELETALPEWKIVVGTIEAFQLHDFIKKK